MSKIGYSSNKNIRKVKIHKYNDYFIPFNKLIHIYIRVEVDAAKNMIYKRIIS